MDTSWVCTAPVGPGYPAPTPCHYVCAVHDPAPVSPTLTTVVLRPTNRPEDPAPAPQPMTPADRAALAAAERALLDERRTLDGVELAALAALDDGAVVGLAALAHQVRLTWCGPTVEVEGILSAKTGGCPEDCHFCSQSSRFDSPVKALAFLDTEEVLAAARQTAALGATEFCLVLALRGPDERTMGRLLELVPRISDETGLQVAVSAGILTDDQARAAGPGGRPSLQPQPRDGPLLLRPGGHHPPVGGAGRDLPPGPRPTAWSCAAGSCSGWASPMPSASR